MPKAIACIPHKLRMDAHRVDYLRAISEAMDHPWQSEDGRGPSHSTKSLSLDVDSILILTYGNLQTAVLIHYR